MHFAMIPVGYDGWNTRYPFQLGIPQAQVEGFLEERLAAQGTTVLRGHEVIDFAQNKDSVTVRVRTLDGEIRLTAKYLVGCDGGRSVVRKGLDMPFPGVDGEGFGVVADVLFGKAPDGVQKQWRSMRNIGRPTGATTFTGLVPLGEPGLYRFIYGDRASRPSDMRTAVSFDEVRQELKDKYDDSATVSEIRWASRFSDAARQAECYRVDRVLLAGDAAHIHFPAGGQGLHLGVQDAMNLGWKLAATVQGWADASLLDTYESERHPVGAQVLENVAAQLGLTPRSREAVALCALFTELAALPEVSRHLSGMVSGLRIRYTTHGTAHPRARLAPDRPRPRHRNRPGPPEHTVPDRRLRAPDDNRGTYRTGQVMVAEPHDPTGRRSALALGRSRSVSPRRLRLLAGPTPAPHAVAKVPRSLPAGHRACGSKGPPLPPPSLPTAPHHGGKGRSPHPHRKPQAPTQRNSHWGGRGAKPSLAGSGGSTPGINAKEARSAISADTRLLPL